MASATQTWRCAAVRSPRRLEISSRFCRDRGIFRDDPSQTDPQAGLAPPVHHITNVDDHGGIPAKVDPNWKTYNNFRSGDLSPPDGLSAPDLVMVAPDACVNECVDPDIANLYVQLGNVGGVPLVGAVIEVYGTSGGVEKLLFTQEVAGPIEAGALQAAVAVATATTGLDEIRLVAVAKEAECVVDAANEVVFVPPFCAP